MKIPRPCPRIEIGLTVWVPEVPKKQRNAPKYSSRAYATRSVYVRGRAACSVSSFVRSGNPNVRRKRDARIARDGVAMSDTAGKWKFGFRISEVRRRPDF